MKKVLISNINKQIHFKNKINSNIISNYNTNTFNTNINTNINKKFNIKFISQLINKKSTTKTNRTNNTNNTIKIHNSNTLYTLYPNQHHYKFSELIKPKEAHNDISINTSNEKTGLQVTLENEFDKQNREITQKYKIYDSSTKAIMEEIKEEVPEIKNHYEFTKYIKDLINQEKQDEILNKEGIVILKTKDDILHKYQIDPHHYFKYLDRDYEVDIHYEQTRDLFEKQRVNDNYVENYKGEVQKLMGFYENRFKYTKHNKFKYLIYKNNYRMFDIQKVLFKSLFTLVPLSFVLLIVNPIMLLLLVPDYLCTIRIMAFLDKLVDEIYLNEDKISFSARTFNFLGNITKLNKYHSLIITKVNIYQITLTF